MFHVGANFRTVHVFVLRGSQLLLQRLAPSRERHPERWGSSVAAYLHAGESYEHAARRRLYEEIGLRGTLTRIGKTRMEDDGSLKFVELYTANDGPLSIRDRSHVAEVRYWDEEELGTAIMRTPERFTPTFLHVYRFFRAARDDLSAH